MTKNDKYTILFDGNFNLFKCYHAAKGFANGNMNFFDTPEADKNMLLWKLAVDFGAEIKRFSSITENIVYAIDGSSWRKHFFDEDLIEEGTQIKYKGNREQSKDVDWTAIFKVHDEFIEALKTMGVHVIRLDGCEGDDLVFAWSSILNTKDKNALIISGDNDLIQLVNHDSANGTNTLYFNKFLKSIYAGEGFAEWVDKSKMEALDIFDMPIDIQDNSKNALKTLTKTLGTVEVNTTEFQFKKILKGDSGDNVAPIYAQRKIYKSGKKKGQEYFSSPGPKAIDEILRLFKEHVGLPITESMFWNKESVKQICNLVKTTCGYKDVSVETLTKNFENNRALMILHSKSIPSPIMESMTEDVLSNYKNELALVQINNLKESGRILDNTTYEKKEQKKQSSAGFFGQFDL